jgi:1,4-dihydroxy-6-naphthoate synthase
LGAEAMTEVTAVLRQSIEFGLAHREEAVEHSLRYARDMSNELADKFVGMYVNEWTIDYGELGRKAVRELLRRGHEIGMVPTVYHIDFID